MLLHVVKGGWNRISHNFHIPLDRHWCRCYLHLETAIQDGIGSFVMIVITHNIMLYSVVCLSWNQMICADAIDVILCNNT